MMGRACSVIEYAEAARKRPLSGDLKCKREGPLLADRVNLPLRP